MKKINRKYSEDVEPIKNKYKLREFLAEMKKHRNGQEMATVFITSMLLLLRVSDVLKLKCEDVFDLRGKVKSDVRSYDRKTGKVNILQFQTAKPTLLLYKDWLKSKNIQSVYLFPAIMDKNKPLSRNYYYNFLKRIADYIGLKKVGTHSARKTGAYQIYKQTGNLALVMNLLNQSNERVTERYLGIKGQVQTNALSKLSSNFYSGL